MIELLLLQGAAGTSATLGQREPPYAKRATTAGANTVANPAAAAAAASTPSSLLQKHETLLHDETFMMSHAAIRLIHTRVHIPFAAINYSQCAEQRNIFLPACGQANPYDSSMIGPIIVKVLVAAIVILGVFVPDDAFPGVARQRLHREALQRADAVAVADDAYARAPECRVLRTNQYYSTC